MTDVLRLTQEATHSAAPEESSLHAEAYQRHLPNPLGGENTVAFAGLGAAIGMTKAGLLTDGLTSSVLGAGLKFGLVGLGYGIAGGVLNYEFTKTHSNGYAELGLITGAGVNLARVAGTASGAELIRAGLNGGATGCLFAGGLGIAVYELKKHHIL